MPRKRRKTILLLDDEATERATAVQILQGEDYTILEAESCRHALDVFGKNRDSVDLLIADISLPDGNGCQLAISTQGQKPNLRVLFVSGHVGAEVCRFYGLDVSDLHFLRKPFQPADLIQAVRRVFSAKVGFPRILLHTRTA